MENYIVINGKKLELTQQQAEKFRESICVPEIKLADVAVGDVVKVGSHELVVLEHREEGTALIRRELLPDDMEFGSNNNYSGSYVEDKCKEFAEEIAGLVGEENLIEHTVDLTSDDGLKDYGKIKSLCSLLTTNLYRRYVEILDKFKPDRWWWLATPHSTERHGNSSWVKCVAPSGNFNDISYIYHSGVRPFCILKSNIFISK